MAQYAHHSIPDPEWVIAAEKSLKPVPSNVRQEDLWAEDNRAIYEPQLPKGARYRVTDHAVPVDNEEIRVRVVIPDASEGPFPLVVHYHGGGFMSGDIPMKDYRLRVLSTKLNVVIVNVDYRLKPFPYPQDDSFAALRWAVTNAKSLCADPHKGFVVTGASAGGQIAAVMAQRARDDPFFRETPLTGQLLQVPSLCHYDHYPVQYKDRLLSMEQNKDAMTFTKDDMSRVYGFLGGDPRDPGISPLLASSLIGLPRAFLQVAGLDPLRDEAILYSDLLREAGVETKLEIYSGMPHSFEDLAFESRAGKRFAQDVEDALRWMIQL